MMYISDSENSITPFNDLHNEPEVAEHDISSSSDESMQEIETE